MASHSWSPSSSSHSLGSQADQHFSGSRTEGNNNVHTPSSVSPVTDQSNINHNSNDLLPIEFDDFGLPVDIGSEQFSSKLGIVARSVVPPGIEHWKLVSNSMKEEIWNRIRSTYNVPEAAKKRVLTKANKSWKYGKSVLYAHCDKALEEGTVDDLRNNVPEGTKKEDWSDFVDIYLSKDFENARKRAKVARSMVQTPHTTGRRGIRRVHHQMKKESTTGNVDRPLLYIVTHDYKDIPDDPLHTKHIASKKVEEVRNLYESNPNSSTQKHLDSDAVATCFGRDKKGYVRGMGGQISKTDMLASAPSREQLHIEKLKNQDLQTQIDALAARTNVLEVASQDNNTAGLSTSAPQQDQVTACILRNMKKKAVALGRVNFSAPPNDENFAVLIDEIIDGNMELCVGDGTLGDLFPGETIEWPQQYVTRAPRSGN